LNSFTEIYTQIFGKAPTGIKYEALKAANMASQNLSRVALLTPNSPKEAVAALRQAFTSLSKDEEFIGEAKKQCASSRVSMSVRTVRDCAIRY